MSSAETGPARVVMSRRSLVRGLALLVAAAPALSACGGEGFRPLYAATPSGVGLEQRLAKVDFAPIPGRVGQRIRNELIFHSTGGGTAATPAHRLEVVVKESLTSTLVNVKGDALGQIYAIEANFRLISVGDKQIVFQGVSNARAGFDRFESIYSNVRAREDAENRTAKTIAEDIKLRLATYLSGAA